MSESASADALLDGGAGPPPDQSRVVAADGDSGHRPVRDHLKTWARRLWAPALAGTVALALGLLHVRTGQWSMYDEYTHFDYVVKIAQDLDAPPANDTLGQTGLQTAACERAPGFEALYPLCGQAIDPATAPYAGLSTATTYLPTYYLPTGLLARMIRPILEAVNPGHSATYIWLMSARLVGALYLGLLAALLVGLGRRLGGNDVAAISAAVMGAASPMVLTQFSTVNNDQFGVLLSALAVLLWLALEKRPPWSRVALSYGTALLAMTAKETALVAVVAIVVLHIFESWRRRPGWRSLPLPVLLGTAVLGAYVVLRAAWPAMNGSLPGNPLQAEFITSVQGDPPFSLMASQVLPSFLSSLSVPFGLMGSTWFTSLSLILASAAFGGAALRAFVRGPAPRPSPERALAAVLAPYLILFPIVFLLYLDRQGGLLYFQPRYLLPAMVLAVTLTAARMTRASTWTVAISAVCYCILVVSVLS